MNFEDYKKIKDIAKRYSFLKELAIRHPEKTSKEFFLAVFKKERYLDMRLTAIRGYAVFATEKEIEPLMKKMTELLRKRPQTTPYNPDSQNDLSANISRDPLGLLWLRVYLYSILFRW